MLRIFLIATLLFSFLSSHAQTVKDSTIQVGYTGSEPFSVVGETPKGIAIDLWREIAFKTDIAYNFVPYKTVDLGLAAIKDKKIDVLVGPITINSDRALRVSFSQPYFDTEMAILAPILDLTIWDRIQPFFSTTFLYAVIGLLLVLTFVGVLFWLAEGKYMGDEYGNSAIKGIGNGIWLAIVTMTTVGYGDYAPKTVLGRFIIGSWMIISLIMATSFVAGIATTLSITSKEGKTITSLSHLENKTVAIPANQRLIDNVNLVGGKPVIVSNAKDGYTKLLNGQVDAMVYDVIPLEYVFENSKKADFVISKKNIYPQHYGFAFQEANALKKQVDLELLKLKESDAVSRIINTWINNNE